MDDEVMSTYMYVHMPLTLSVHVRDLLAQACFEWFLHTMYLHVSLYIREV